MIRKKYLKDLTWAATEKEWHEYRTYSPSMSKDDIGYDTLKYISLNNSYVCYFNWEDVLVFRRVIIT